MKNLPALSPRISVSITRNVTPRTCRGQLFWQESPAVVTEVTVENERIDPADVEFKDGVLRVKMRHQP